MEKDVVVGNDQANLGFVRTMGGGVVRIEAEFEEVPHDAPPIIRNSKRASDYCSWIRDSWTGTECSRKAKELFGEDVSDESFYRLARIIRLREKIIPNYKATLLRGDTAKFDVVQEMRNIIALHFRRIAEIQKKEQAMQDLRGGVPYVSKAMQAEQDATSQDLAVLFQMEMKQKEFNLERSAKMGIVTDQDVIQASPLNALSEENVKRMLSEFTNEQAFAMQMALIWVRKVYYLELNDRLDWIMVEEYANAVLEFNARSERNKLMI